MKYRAKIDTPWIKKGEIYKPELLYNDDKLFSLDDFPDLFEPVVEEEPEIKLWDVVRLNKTGAIGVVLQINGSLCSVYHPHHILCNSYEKSILETIPNKVAMAPALIKSIHGCYYLTDPIRIVKSGAPVITREVGDSFIRWPHSIASLTIEDKS